MKLSLNMLIDIQIITFFFFFFPWIGESGGRAYDGWTEAPTNVVLEYILQSDYGNSR